MLDLEQPAHYAFARTHANTFMCIKVLGDSI